jgi:hypothetical protein
MRLRIGQESKTVPFRAIPDDQLGAEKVAIKSIQNVKCGKLFVWKAGTFAPQKCFREAQKGNAHVNERFDRSKELLLSQTSCPLILPSQ